MPFRLSRSYLRGVTTLISASRSMAERRPSSSVLSLQLLHAALAGRAEVEVVVVVRRASRRRARSSRPPERQPADGAGAAVREVARAEVLQRHARVGRDEARPDRAVAADQPQAAEDRLRDDVLAVGQHLDVLREARAGSPAKSTRAREHGLEAVPVAVVVVVDDRRPLRREATASSTTRCPVSGTRSVNGSLKPPGGAGSTASWRPESRSSTTTRGPAVPTPIPGSVTKTWSSSPAMPWIRLAR